MAQSKLDSDTLRFTNVSGLGTLIYNGTDFTLNSSLSLGGTNKTTDLADPTNPQDGATKNYVDTRPSFPDNLTRVTSSAEVNGTTRRQTFGLAGGLTAEYGGTNWGLTTDARYTAPVAGYYQVMVMIKCTSSVNLTETISLNLDLNGAGTYNIFLGCGENHCVNGSATLYMNSGDYITVATLPQFQTAYGYRDYSSVTTMRISA